MKKLTALFLAIAIIAGAPVSAFASDDFRPFEDSEFFTMGDYDIHYRVVPAQGRFKGRILMIHGFMCSTYSWRNMAKEMSEAGYECVLADLPDFGFSTRETKDMQIIPREELMIALMRTFAPTDEWIVAGHSMGGGVAINIACAVPVKALLLYCPCPQPGFPQWAEKPVKWVVTEKLMDAFFALGANLRLTVRAVIWAATADFEFAMKYDLHGVTDPLKYDGFGSGICEMMYNVQPTDTEGAKELDIPVLLVNGEKDIILNKEQKATINETFDGRAECHMIEGAGHQCIEDRSEEIAAITVTFLENNKVAG